ncbi:hypothetical protein Z043_101125 [Scleropages formosus]|uniref:D-glutamate cyclase-like C-terminal domain-containing protein n=1 Tax=Scleropages formosus TaxID=113540 RepID=A0A0P7UYI8_SCLFO|nr:hypothetical protein Z043_101125 [Scleropages formosus]
MTDASPSKGLIPSAVRVLIRSKTERIANTSGLAPGFQQANVVILHETLADDFEAFCRANRGPLPLLYRSKPGEWGCSPLAENSDIRVDCAQYCVFENGALAAKVSSLTPYTAQLRDMVTFYLGCSFSFEQILKAAEVPVRNVEQGRNVSMFRTSVPCVEVGSFRCPMVVSMRPIPAEKLDAAARATHLAPLSHGAPVHIGDPALLGIRDASQPDYGDPVVPAPGDVPVFWGCGVTGVEAVRSCKTPLAFTHSPGCMFLSDQEMFAATSTTDPRQRPLTFSISQKPLRFSLVSEAAVHQIRALEKLIGEDPGERGIQALFVQDELLKSCLSLSHASSVLITTGFPTHFQHNPPEETDGPPGAIAMAAMLRALGKRVAMVTDRRALDMNRRIMDDAVQKGKGRGKVKHLVLSAAGLSCIIVASWLFLPCAISRFDHLVAIERSGRAADGNYYNMRAINIKHLVDPIDDLFTAAASIAGIGTTGTLRVLFAGGRTRDQALVPAGIGDGGNELGMGKVRGAVRAHMPKGNLIACDVAADYAITAGVSNWGGYAVACGLYLLNACLVHERYLRKGLGTPPSPQQLETWAASLPTVAKEEEFLAILVKHGVRSGKTANLALEVDGLPFHPTHSTIIRKMRELAL